MSRPVWMTGGTLCFRVVRPSFRPSRFRGTTLRAAPSKSYAFSTNYHACIAMPTWPRCAPPILFSPWPPYNLLLRLCLTWIFFGDPHWWVPLCVQHPAKVMPFQQIIMHALHNQHDVDVHLLFCFWPWPAFNLFPRPWFNLYFLCGSSLIGMILCALLIKSCVIITNYHACIAMLTWYTSPCTPILFWPP